MNSRLPFRLLLCATICLYGLSFFLVSVLFLTGHVRGQSKEDSPLTLYVASGHTDQVLRYDGTTGDFLGVFAQGGGLDDGPIHLAFGPDGHLYIYNPDTAEVLRYDGRTGRFLDIFVKDFPGGGSPIIFGPHGDLYLGSGNTDQVLRYDGTTGDFLGVFAQGGGLDLPSGMIFSGSWVTTLIRYHLVR